MRKRRLERALAGLDGFDDPRVDLEQYPTPADLAAHVVHRAALHGDLDGRAVDLGAGTGILGIGAAIAGADVVGVEVDPGALSIARRNAERAGVDVDWVLGDVRRHPLRRSAGTVLSNPPFGAQDDNEGADRAFLAAAADVADVSYTVHNEGSREFVEAFAGDNGGTVTHGFRGELGIDRQFEFHERPRRTIPVEVFRVEWRG